MMTPQVPLRRLRGFLALTVCVLSFHLCQASVIRRCIVPHNVEPGHIVTALSKIGQRYEIVTATDLDPNKHSTLPGHDFTKYFTVLSNGDLVTNQAINDLVGNIFSLTIDNILPGGKWQNVVHIHVQDASNLLVFPKQKYEGHIAENQPVASPVQGLDDLYAIAKYGNKKVTYAITSGDSNVFELKQNTIGADHVTVVTKIILDREEKNEYNLVIQARDDDGDVTATDVKIIIDDVDDNVPTFESTLYKSTIPDTTAPESLILFVKASDPDEQRISYMLKSPNHFFQVVEENGAIVLKTNIMLKPDVYNLDVVAVDEASHRSDPARVEITVTGTGNSIYQPEELTEKILHRSKRVVRRPFTVNVKENQRGQLFYVGSAANGEKFQFIEPIYKEFDLDYDNGAVWLTPGQKLDYDFSRRSYDIRVNITKPSDPFYSDIQEINLKVTDVNDEPPIFTNMPREMIAAVDMNAFEGHVVYELHAADRDLNASIRYYIVSGAQNYFTVSSRFGTIKLIRKGISQNHRKFTLAVMAKDVASYYPQNVTDRLTIHVGKLDPQFYLNFYDVTVPEMSKTDKVLAQIKARSFQREPVTYRLKTESGANSTDFYINETTGNVYAYREFRYEEQPRTFNLMVYATENPISGERKTSRVPLRINVTDINNHIPSFPLSSYIKENISEDIPVGTEILTVAASDYDGGRNGRLTYTVDNDHFNVRNHNNKGYITVARDLDYDRLTEHAYNFRVFATDGGKSPLTGSTSVQIIMRNINDEVPQFPLNVSYHSVDENAMPGTTVAVVQAIDIDGSSISYSFEHGDTADIFKINPISGMITLEKPVDADRDFYTLNVFATDDGSCVPCTSTTKPLMSNASIVVEVMDINNHRPDFPDCRRYAPVVKEELDPGARVTQVKAKDDDSGSNGKILYSIVYPRHEDKYFIINNTTGEIFTSYKFKREGSKKQYSVTVKAEDQGRPSLQGVCSFQVHILDINDHVPEFDKPRYAHTMMMDTAPSVSILRVYATDRDEGNNAQVRYHMTSDDCGNFAINEVSGVITLDRTFPAPCYELLQPTICNLTIEARDNGREPPPEPWQKAAVQIRVNSSEQQPPRWLIDDGTSFKIDELTPQGYTVVTLAAMPPVAGQLVSFDIVSIDGNDFFFTPSGSSDVQPFRTLTHTDKNEVELKVNSPMDYESIKEYRVKLRATVGDKSSELLLNISLHDKNDNAPTFTSYNSLLGNYQGSIGENVPAGKSVIQVTAYDLDTEPAFKTVTYRLQKTADWKDFRINKKTGEIFSNKEFDRETKDEYRITVIAEDGAPSDAGNDGPNIDFKGVIIAIADQNDNAPYFEKSSYNTTISELADITSSVITVTAKDSDSSAKLTYSIVGGNKHNVFGIREGVGEIYVAQALDYDTDPKVYNLKVRVFDGKYYNDTNVQITLLNENDNPPVFNPAFYNVNTVIEHDIPPPEGKFLVQTHAIDVDAAYTNIYYALSGADANEYFKIDGQGRLFQIKEIDREAPDSSVRLWEFNVLGTDERLTGYAVVNIEVQDINDNAPIFVDSLLRGYLKENAGPGIEVLKIEAKDSDKGENQTVYYEIVDQVPRVGQRQLMAFEMRDDTSGKIYTVLSGIDREDNIDEFKLIIRARDGGSPPKATTATATIIIIDENDNAPKFNKKTYQIEIPENLMNGTTFHTISATDDDFSSNGHLTFTIDENSRKTFSIQSIYVTDTGVLQVYNMSRLDYEEPKFRRFNLDLKVSDGKFTDTARVKVKVIDVNDNKPIFRGNASVTMYENEPVGTSIKTFIATDDDEGENAMFDYKIDPMTDPHNNLAIDRHGEVTVAKPLDREQWTSDKKHKSLMTARILAVDRGNPPQTGSASLTITLLDVNDNYPMFDEEYRPVVYENTEPPSFVVSIHAWDPDNSTNGPPFTFTEPADSPTREYFSLQFIQGGDNGNGAGDIKTKAKFDREKQKYYYMPIIMTDRQGMSGTNTLTITIGDRNDNMHQPGHKNIDIYNYEGRFRETFIGNVYAQDYDDWDLPDKFFEFIGDPPPYFRVERTGALYLTSYLPEGRYNMEFKVTDNYYLQSVISTVTVISRNIPQEPVHNAGSFRITGMTAEQFVDRQLYDSSKPNAYKPSMYMKFREKIAKILMTQLDYVEIFSVVNCHDKKNCVDVRYSAHGSPYYKPARLDGVLDQHRDEFNEILQKKYPDAVIALVPVDLCMDETCEAGCSNILVIGQSPLVINTNSSSLVGIDSYITAKCECKAKDYTMESRKCTPASCFNDGVCKQREDSFSCSCRKGFDGPRCQQTKRQFNGDGWAWFPPLKQCLETHTSLSFMTREDGLLLYNGPMRVPSMEEPTDFIAVEIVNGYVRVTVDQGTGPKSVTVGRRRRGKPVTDGKWHRIDIFRQGRLVRVVVDNCRKAPIRETGQSIQDRNACERYMETPGPNQFINVNQPLQLGGRKNLLSPFPGSLISKAFKGCVKDLIHDGELFDLHIGEIGEQDGSSDGCPDEEVHCGGNAISGSHCVNGKCISNLIGQVNNMESFKCICDPGWKGQLCNTRTKEINFNENSYMKWKLSQVHLMDHFTSDIQIMFRTRQRNGILMYFKGQYNTREFMMLRVNNYRLEFQYNLGIVDKELSLHYVNASNGEWHTVNVERFGKSVRLKMDIGEGPFYNHTSGDTHGHQITRLEGTVIGGDDDYTDSCLMDPRYNNGWLPVDRMIENSAFAEILEVKNVTMGCTSSSCLGKYCIQPFVCVDKWRLQVCECPAGYYEGYDNTTHIPTKTCFNVSECLSSPCIHGACFDRVNDYFCDCEFGWEGTNCGTRQERVVAALSTGALVAILVCLFLLMLLVLAFVIYTRRRQEDDKYILEVDPDDDVRENIVNYDEEGAGEEDHDGYDLSRLRKPEETPKQPKVEKAKTETTAPTPAPKPAPPPRTTPSLTKQPIDVGEFINNRLKSADNDPKGPPHDTPNEYNYEGGGSTAGSLSSLNSENSNADQDYNFLNTFGPRFTKLANMYGGGED